jgi:hypothetical protein
MIHLAHLSIDPRVRSVARAWHSLTEVERIETRIEEVCRAAGIGGADFIGCVAGTAWELGIDVAAFLTGRPGQRGRLRLRILTSPGMARTLVAIPGKSRVMQPVSEMWQKVFKRRIASQWMGFPKSWNGSRSKTAVPEMSWWHSWFPRSCLILQFTE